MERIVSSPGVELSACSIGIVMRVSTSSVDIPRPSVCTSTNGGANSGKTSTGMLLTRVAPKPTIPTASATTMKRNCRLDLTIHRIMGGGPPEKASAGGRSLALDREFRAEELLAADGHDLGARIRPFS